MTRTLFIGLDGFAFHILDDFIKDIPGRGVVMPFMRDLMARVFRAPLLSTPHPLTPPAWITMVTGKNPGQHGVYDFMNFEDKGDEVFFTLYDFRDILTETVWSIASRQERSVAALNFPMTAPPPKINGSLIPGFTSSRHLRRNSTPPDLFERLKRMPGFDPKELAWDFERENEIGLEMDDDYLARWIGYHLPREELWHRVAVQLMEEDKPDLMSVMFDGADKIQHQAWQFIDPDLRPAEPDERFLRMQKLCMEYYRRLDSYIENLIRIAGPDTRVFMASDHGFSTTTYVLRINRYLADLGHLVYREVGEGDAAQRRANSPFAYLDWEKTKAYCPTPSSNAIHIRVARNPGEPGVAPSEYHAFRERLIEDLYRCKDPETGERVIVDVLKREDVFPGIAMESAPDLTLRLSDNGFVSIRNMDPIIVQRSFPAGTHHPYGVFMAAGPGINAVHAEDALDIADVAATLLYSMGLPVPQDFEGKVAMPALSAAQLAEFPVRKGAATLPVARGEVVMADSEAGIPEDEKQKILDQLAMLGYLED